ncbi:MAG: ABC transporter ATP-binding protein [Spirochaetota bacterium]
MVVGQLMGVMRSAISMVGVLALVASVLPWYALAALVVASGPLGLVRTISSRREFSLRMRRTMAERGVLYLNWLLTGRMHAKELRIFGLSSLLRERSAQKRDELRRERLALRIRVSSAEVLAYVVQTAAVFVVVGIVTVDALRGEASIGDLVLLIQAVQRGQNLMSELLLAVNGLYESNLFLKTVFEFLGLKPVVVDPESPRPVPSPITQGIEIRDVSFRYPNSDHQILDKVSLSVRAGEVVALVGDNGAGKTTLLKLVCRFYDPLTGSVSVDGIDLRELAKEEWWAQVTALFQDYAQYHYTVWENIWFGRAQDEPDWDRIRRAAKAARSEQFIEAFENGYRTPLGRFLEEGAGPSGGQWKKLALARTFYRDSPVAILDEPTSSLDPETEAELLGELREWARARSVLLVTHRIAAARTADRIYVMRDGRIEEHGSHDELVGRNGYYARMYRMQRDQLEGRR